MKKFFGWLFAAAVLFGIMFCGWLTILVLAVILGAILGLWIGFTSPCQPSSSRDKNSDTALYAAACCGDK